MKLIILLFLGYYANCQNLSDSLLKSALHDTITTGERFHYGTHGINNLTHEYYTGTWSYFPLSDQLDNGQIWDMYSNSVRYFPAVVGESGCSLQIEHCLPKSWWGGESANKRAYQDLFNLNPADARANVQKSNYPPGHVTQGDKFDNGSFRMDSKNKSQYGYICFEPAPEYRGDFARAYFYIATAYEDTPWVSNYTTGNTAYVTNNSYLEFSDNLVSVLLDWHRADPVDEKEIHRAAVITSLQGNHNPYIDYPELVELIWGNRKGEAADFDALTCTFDPDYVPEPYIPEPQEQLYDTLINLPALTANLINAVQGTFSGSANSGIQSNGTASITMGRSSTDGEITFTGTVSEDAILVFRASPYNTATSMQLDVYADDEKVLSIQETVVNETRNEVRYQVDIPAGTQTIRLVSVGGGTSKRACMQELYLLHCLPEPTPPDPEDPTDALSISNLQSPISGKLIQNGSLYIRHNQKLYSVYGSQVR
ncbi:MAG: endonuclease [Paludibacteraceae bacterium]|nr:endonuclease [Paludibacteraceae bacterium]